MFRMYYQYRECVLQDARKLSEGKSYNNILSKILHLKLGASACGTFAAKATRNLPLQKPISVPYTLLLGHDSLLSF